MIAVHIVQENSLLPLHWCSHICCLNCWSKKKKYACYLIPCTIKAPMFFLHFLSPGKKIQLTDDVSTNGLFELFQSSYSSFYSMIAHCQLWMIPCPTFQLFFTFDVTIFGTNKSLKSYTAIHWNVKHFCVGVPSVCLNEEFLRTFTLERSKFTLGYCPICLS